MVSHSCCFRSLCAGLHGLWYHILVACVCRRGALFVEEWVDGFAFSELSSRQDLVSSQREELERQKKQMGKKKGQHISPQEQLEREEMFKMRAALLRKVKDRACVWCVCASEYQCICYVKLFIG